MSGRAAIVVLLIVIVIALLLMGGNVLLGSGQSEIIKAISSGESVECDLTINLAAINLFNDVEPPGGAITAKVKVKSPNARMDGRLKSLDFTYITNSRVGYVYLPMFDEWYVYSEDVMGIGIPTPKNLVENLANPQAGLNIECRETADIPDSEFTLPAGVIPKRMPDVMGDLKSYMYE